MFGNLLERIFRSPPNTPDGSPDSDWREYEYAPQSDITAYETAMLIWAILDDVVTQLPIENPRRFFVHRNIEKRPEYWPVIERHFKAVEN